VRSVRRMARPLRIQMAGLTYHVHGRGNGRMDIYLDDFDRRIFLEFLAEVVTAFNVICHAFCLMRNHYHLVVTTSDANLSGSIHTLNGRYGQWWNRRHEHVGHVFQGRFGAKIVQDDVHLLTVTKYVVSNPVRKRLVESPDQWPWSSHRATAGLEALPSFLCPQTLWRLLGDGDLETNVLRYRKFMATPIGVDADKLLKAPVIGDPEFVQRFEGIRRRASREVPSRERNVRPSLESLFSGAVTRAERNARASMARSAGYSMREISGFLGLHRTTVVKMVAAAVLGSGVNKATPSDQTPEGVKKAAVPDLTPKV
jgi:putative transposase